MSRITWRGEEYLKALAEAVDSGLAVAAAVAARAATKNMGSESGGLITGGEITSARRAKPPSKLPRPKFKPMPVPAGLSALERGDFFLARSRARAAFYRAHDVAARQHGRQRFRAAKPGDFPGYRTGHLAHSLTFQTPEEGGTPGVAAYGTNVKYGRYLEYGTTRMQPRPWAMRTVRMAAPEMRSRFVFALRARLRGIARRFP